jgi:hypothetical protein
MDEVDEVVGQVAAKHDVLLGRDDPALVIPTLVQIGIQRAMAELRTDEPKGEHLSDSSAIAETVRKLVADDIAKAGIAAATLVANVEHAHARPQRVYWTSVGLALAILLLLIGILIGRFLL